MLAVPLLGSAPVERCLGVLCVARARVGPFSAEYVGQIESVAREMSVLLGYAWQYKRLLDSARDAEQRADRQTQELRLERLLFCFQAFYAQLNPAGARHRVAGHTLLQ